MKPVIGLETHIELKTRSKMFCACPSDYFGKQPNTLTCPVCLGLPGALPVPNKIAIEWCIMLGLSLNCHIPLISKFDRKNYFYPDLPKGYQISQYDEPFCLNGYLKLSSGKKIKIRRVHMEEDTGKLIHAKIHNQETTLIDFNRSGVPLVEIVTEPDFDNAMDVKEYLQKLQQIVRYLKISDADMEKGNMRLEPNISLSQDGKLPEYKVEIKNINSFRFVEEAIEYEIKRQKEIIKRGQKPVQETRGWNERERKTVSQRTKEEASDYRYFPEPDIPPIRWTLKDIAKIKAEIPELPNERKKRFVNNYKLSEKEADILTKNPEIADYFEKTVSVGSKKEIKPKNIAVYLINKKINFAKTEPEELVKKIISEKTFVEIDNQKIKNAVSWVIKNNVKAVEEYKNGKTQVLQYLIGQTLKRIKEKIDPKTIIKEINIQLK